MKLAGREPAIQKSNTIFNQPILEEVPADSASSETLETELEEACAGILADTQTVVGELSESDLEDLTIFIEDRVADIKFYLEALAARQQRPPQIPIQLPSNVIELPLPVTLTDNSAA
jgi:hypothetical protein